jgi:nifR3 family TIM-barrel protein
MSVPEIALRAMHPGLHPVHVGTVEIPDNVWLAPMAGYTDAAFRSVCVSHGVSLCFTEMVSADALSRDNALTLRLLTQAPNEVRLGFQIFASEPKSAAAAVRRIASMAPTLIDLNCGCSVPKVLVTGCGAALLRSPRALGAIVAAMRAETDIPLSVKLRSGWDASSLNFRECAEEAVAAGAVLVTLHPRTRSQGFSGRACQDHIRVLKESCPVPVVGSGDLFSAEDCRLMLEKTGCDAVMIARGCLGNPFIFQQTKALLGAGNAQKGSVQPGSGAQRRVDARERLTAAIQQLRLLAGSVGEAKACRDMRKHFAAYTKGLESAATIRQCAMQAETIADYEDIVESYLRF